MVQGLINLFCCDEATMNAGEVFFYNALKKYLYEKCIVYYNREIYGREFDFCILLPDIGIAVVEVKGWAERTVLRVVEGQTIEISTDSGIQNCNPRIQARGYRFAVQNLIKTKLWKKPVVFHMVCYPFISEAFYKKSTWTLSLNRK